MPVVQDASLLASKLTPTEEWSGAGASALHVRNLRILGAKYCVAAVESLSLGFSSSCLMQVSS